MKNLLYVSALIFVICSANSFAQVDCPTLDVAVSSTPESTPHGQFVTFTANVGFNSENDKNRPLKYYWQTRGGKLIEGQGTPVIKVRLGNASPTAVVIIDGFPAPETCLHSDTETFLVDSTMPLPIAVSEFSIGERIINHSALDYFFRELAENAQDRGLIIEKFKKDAAPEIIAQKLKKLSHYISSKTSDASRITIVHVLADENSTQFWRIPPGASNPDID